MNPTAARYLPVARELASHVGSAHGGLAAASVLRAFRIAAEHHDGETRLNGDPYLSHCVAVASIVARISTDPFLISTALLHDVLDGGGHTLERVDHEIGPEVAELVVLLAAFDKRSMVGLTKQLDTRIVVLKLADRLHNLRTIRALNRVKQVQKAEQTLAVLLPLAEVFGVPFGDELGREARRVLEPSTSLFEAPVARSRVLRLAAALLPCEARGRWLAEWLGEVSAIPGRSARLGFVLSVLAGAPSMAIALRASITRSGAAP